MGFTESVNRRTGIEELWGELRKFASSSMTVLMPWEWRDDMRALAAFVDRNSQGLPSVMVVAYSWGAGFAFPRFARECFARGIKVDVACLCDPVYRSRWLPWWLPLDPLALTHGRKILLPRNVGRVEWARQKLGMPQGHDLVAEDAAATVIKPAQWIECTHEHIDESPTFRAMVLAAAKRFAEEGAL